MAQCKEPLSVRNPNINICVLEKGHNGLHYTYGLDMILFSTKNRDKEK